MVAFVTPNTLAATFTQLQGSTPGDITTIRNTLGSGSVVANIAALRALSITTYTTPTVNVACYSSTLDGGGGQYILNISDTTSADNNGTIIVDASGRRWYFVHNGIVNADVFGVDATGATDASSRLQQFIDWCQANRVIPELHASGKYKIQTGITIKQGQNSSDAFAYDAILYGNNATLFSYGGITTLSIIPRCLSTDYATGRLGANVIIRNLNIDGFNANTSGTAIKFGAQNYCAYCNSYGDVSDILIIAFPNGNILTIIQDFSHVVFNRFVQKAAGTLLITSTNTTGLMFCGDHMFNECQMDGNAAHPPVKITCGQTGVTSSNQCRGIKFNTCDIYNAGTFLDVRGNGNQVGDIWFNAVQFDGGGNFGPAALNEIAIFLQSSDNSSMFQIHIVDCYWAGFNGPAVYAVQNGSSVMKMCDITGGAINDNTCAPSVGNTAIGLVNVSQFAINHVILDKVYPGTSPSGSCVIQVINSTNIQVNNCTAINSNGVMAGIAIGSSNNYVLTGNIMNITSGAPVINEFGTPATTKAVANNIA